MRRHELGLSLISTLILGVILMGSIILAMRCVPVYNEYFTVKRALSNIAASSDIDSAEGVRAAFKRRVDLGDVSSVSASDLDIAKENGRFVISAQWERRVPLVANISLVFAFQASSSANASSSQ
jgi:hypothetical protein